MSVDPTKEWWEDRETLDRLARWLENRGEFTDPIYFMEKPWKWRAEYEQMLREQLEAAHRLMGSAN